MKGKSARPTTAFGYMMGLENALSCPFEISQCYFRMDRSGLYNWVGTAEWSHVVYEFFVQLFFCHNNNYELVLWVVVDVHFHGISW